MIKELIKLATHLDARGLRKEADYLDVVIKRAKNLPPLTDIHEKALDAGNEFEQSTGIPSAGTSGRGEAGMQEWDEAEAGAAADAASRDLADDQRQLNKSLNWFNTELMPKLSEGELTEGSLSTPDEWLLVFMDTKFGSVRRAWLKPNQPISSPNEHVGLKARVTEVPLVPEWLETAISWAATGGDGAIEATPIREVYLMLKDTVERVNEAPTTASDFNRNIIKLANHLDQKGLVKEANYLDALIKKTAGKNLTIC